MRLEPRYDVVVIGAGIVGLATARALVEHTPSLRVAVVEKEDAVGLHQSGRNSGVIHSGVYYRPGSLKARMCTAGAAELVRFCREHEIPFDVCGKVIVATDEGERAGLLALSQRADENGIAARVIDPAELAELEPHARGVAALHVPSTGVVDFGAVTRELARLVADLGVELRLGLAVEGVVDAPDRSVVETGSGEIDARCVVNCAGLHADELARQLLGPKADVRIVPFRGEFHELVPERRFLVRHLIYPVPDPELPFLGVHLTRDVHGGVHAGPNAVLALAREGYSWRAVDRGELAGLVRYRGFRRLARRYWRVGATEVRRSLRRRALARALRRLVPDLRVEDLAPAPAGVRAQAVDRDGRLLDDFVIRESPRSVHVLNAPSPAATASLVIGGTIAERVRDRL